MNILIKQKRVYSSYNDLSKNHRISKWPNLPRRHIFPWRGTYVLQMIRKNNNVVIENNVSTNDRKAKMDLKFKSEGQVHKFYLFLKYRKWEMFRLDCFVCFIWFFFFPVNNFQLCWDGYLARINMSCSMTQHSDTGEARIWSP